MGQPSVFIRTFGCNFKCAGFGMPSGEHSIEADKIANSFKLNPVLEYDKLPLAKTGCDSYASWHPAFKSLSPKMTVPQITHQVDVARWQNESVDLPGERKNSHIVITGGEPLLGWQKQYPELLDALADEGYKEITFETNGTQKICDELHDYLVLNHLSGKGLNITFSVSPKLMNSGERMADACKPDIVASYMAYGTVYLKFVVATDGDVSNLKLFVDEYKRLGWVGEVYLMPVGGTQESYEMNAQNVASLAMYHGYRYSPRLQVDLWQNEWGT